MEAVIRTVSANDGVNISYSVFDGASPAVVILHGLAGSSREFVPTARTLSGRKVVLIDQRGHGLSTRLPADTSREAFVGDVVRVIEVEEFDAVDLVGQSMGAHTAMLVAAARPDLVRRLVLLEANEGGGLPEDHAALGDFFRSWDVPFTTRESASAALGVGPLAQAWVADLQERQDGFYPRFDPDVMVAAVSAVAHPRWEEWQAVAAPTLVVYADQGMFTEEQKNIFVSRGPNVLRVDLADASHDAHLDAFDQWIVALHNFVNAR
ncbi:alpha/beta hydrolase [Cryobacterium sinapicolor]|uniref:Alpha/beta hydrolase n=1 Tax=Cryobacterium sinapicolor TaxID=1259236 RepID=A0ABY2J924_9MICO|nr:alpha/beta hydrolase [Cryobacterium sinapicolor]TFD00139.1 alpha/beta hydrolase [Cryobacterium sinapicolor]